MNPEQRAALVEQYGERVVADQERRQTDEEYRAWRYSNSLDHVESIYEFVDRKVAAARADERRAAWQEFEAAMLSDDAVKAAGAVLIDRWDDDRLRNEWELVEKMTEAALHTIAPKEDSHE